MILCGPGRAAVEFAGAGLPLHVWDGHAVTRIQGDRRRVGYRGTRTDAPWTRHTVALTEQTRLYLVTDGLLDQSGGEKGFGFGEERLGGLISECGSLPMRQQETAFRTSIAAWQGARAQRDDLTVFGLWPGRAHRA